MHKALMLALLLAGLPSLAEAQSAADRQRQERACGNDVARFCRRVADQGDSAVLNCLQRNGSKLSRQCRRVLDDNGQL
jgi:type II secretory pathway pseudopilin PulG